MIHFGEQGRVNNPEKSEKQKRWEAIQAEVEAITDRLGLGIDKGIKESVIALKAFDFPTSQSCEGHLEGEHGLAYPWVEIYTPEPNGWEENEEKQREWKFANLREQQKMLGLLEEFYQNRTAHMDTRIVFNRIGAFGGFRIQSMGAETMELLTPERQAEKTEAYKKEIEDFASFLKNKFFGA